MPYIIEEIGGQTRIMRSARHYWHTTLLAAMRASLSADRRCEHRRGDNFAVADGGERLALHAAKSSIFAALAPYLMCTLEGKILRDRRTLLHRNAQCKYEMVGMLMIARDLSSSTTHLCPGAATLRHFPRGRLARACFSNEAQHFAHS